MDFQIKSRRILRHPDEGFREGFLSVVGGKVGELREAPAPGIAVEAWDDHVVMAGLVDTHAHINEPGRTDWEGFATATRAAAAGGVTTVIDMPLNSIPPTTTVAAWKEKAAAAQGKCAIDYGLWGGVIPGNGAELGPLVEAGVFGFKAFLIDSGVEEFPASGPEELRQAARRLGKGAVPLLVHAEMELDPAAPQPKGRTYASYLRSRPEAMEVRAIETVIALARETGARFHIVHLSAASALPLLAQARAEGVPVTVETCPHYLALDAQSIGDGHTEFKCAPPIRDRANQEALWQGLRDGVIDFVVSDHSPCTPALKRMDTGEFPHAWGGIAGIQFGLPVVWTAASSKGIDVGQLSRWMSLRTAAFAGLGAKKGSLERGRDADVVVWSPEQEFTLEAGQILHRHPVTPYLGSRLRGVVQKTWVRGRCVYDKQRNLAETPGLLLRPGLKE